MKSGREKYLDALLLIIALAKVIPLKRIMYDEIGEDEIRVSAKTEPYFLSRATINEINRVAREIGYEVYDWYAEPRENSEIYLEVSFVKVDEAKKN